MGDQQDQHRPQTRMASGVERFATLPYRDAGGWVDCWPSCSPVQHAVGISLWVGPLVGLLVVCVGAAGLVLRRLRRAK
jgi:hypothetical protein